MYPEEVKQNVIKHITKQAEKEKPDDLERTERNTQRNNSGNFNIKHTDTSWYVE